MAKKDFLGTLEQRFWKRVIKKGEDECWGWVGSQTPFGYGQVTLGERHIYAHRFSYELHIGKIPEGLLVLHSCDTPPCTNPKHLWTGTNKENSMDRERKGHGNQAKGEKSGGAKLTWKKVEKIRKMYATKKYLQREIANICNVKSRTIGDIINNKTWKI